MTETLSRWYRGFADTPELKMTYLGDGISTDDEEVAEDEGGEGGDTYAPLPDEGSPDEGTFGDDSEESA